MSDINFKCSSCSQSLEAPSEMGGELIECPSCKQTIEVPRRSVVPPVKIASPPPPTPRTPPRPTTEPTRQAKVVTKTEFAGAGALVQLLGVVACFTVVGIIIGIPLLIIGSNMSKKFLCGDCGNKLPDKNVRLCPVCRTELKK